MSHYVVLVIGDDPEEQLVPFEEGTEDPKYLKFESRQESLEKEWAMRLEYQNSLNLSPDSDELYRDLEHFARDYYGYEQNPNDPNDWGYIRNPNAKWDWYQLGGRWAGCLKLKSILKNGPAVFGDQALAGNVDWAGMIADYKAGVHKDYAAFEAHDLNEIELSPIEQYRVMWDTATPEDRAKFSNDFDQFLLNFRRLQAATYYNLVDWSFDPFEATVPSLEELLDSATALNVYAMLINGEWTAKGEMGWFGMSKDDVSDENWARKVQETIEALDPKTLVSIYDLHI